MSSSFDSSLASYSSSASSPLSYQIPRPPPPPPPPPPLVGQGYATNGASVGVQTSGVDAASAAGAAPRQGSRHAGHPPLPRPPPRQCPRCWSANTKFCYYNNYSRAQPRYLCKACRRHWTEGGTLRDVPGGGRKNKRGGGKGGAKAASTATASATVAATVSSGGGADAFPDILRQMLFQPATAISGGGYSIDLSAWQQMAAATTPQGAGDVGAVGGTAPDANCGGVQYWNGWQQDDMPGLDGAC